MNKFSKGLSIAGLTVGMLLSLPTARALQQGPPPPPPYPGYGQEPWSAPPQELQGAEREGFHDGLEGARRDYENHRPPNVNNRDEYRHPRFGGPDRHAYRQGFRRGYQVGVDHLMRGGPRPY